MANTYNLIEAQTLGSSQSTVTLGSGGTIPQTYTDLRLLLSLDSNGYNGIDTYMRFNSVTSGYSLRYLWKDGAGSTAYADSGASQASLLIGWACGTYSTANTFASFEIRIPNYTSSSNQKPISVENVHESNNNDTWLWLMNGLSNTTSPITSISIIAGSSGTFLANSTFYLYGIKKD